MKKHKENGKNIFISKYFWAAFAIIAFNLIAGLVVLVWPKTPEANKITQIAAPEPEPKTMAKEAEEVKKEIPKTVTYEVPILMYHYVRDAANENQLGKSLSVHPDNFETHLKWLKENNYKTIKLEDVADSEKAAISQAYSENKKPVVLTFDDGYADAYTQAFPLLRKYGFTGTFFIIRDSVGKDDGFYMNQNQIDELTQSGMEIGSHTLNHPNLAGTNIDNARRQIFDSKMGAKVFCYPSGRYNQEVANLTKEAGYTAAVTTNFGIANEKSDLFELRRVRVEDAGAQDLADKISAAREQTPKN